MESNFVINYNSLCQPAQGHEHSFSPWKLRRDPTSWVDNEYPLRCGKTSERQHPKHQPHGTMGKSSSRASGDQHSSGSSTVHRSIVWPLNKSCIKQDLITSAHPPVCIAKFYCNVSMIRIKKLKTGPSSLWVPQSWSVELTMTNDRSVS